MSTWTPTCALRWIHVRGVQSQHHLWVKPDYLFGVYKIKKTISKQIDNTCFDLKASGVEVKDWKQVFQVKPQKAIRNSVVAHLNAKKLSNFYHLIVVYNHHSHLFLALWFLLCGREAISIFDFWRFDFDSCFMLWKPKDRFLIGHNRFLNR